MTQKILVEKKGHTAILTLNNPAANTFDEESLTYLPKIIRELENDKNIYSLVITGQGEKFFSAGADLKMFSSGNKEVASKVANVFGVAFESLSNFRGVSIAAINGYAMGGGLEVALACDLRIVEEQSILALPEATVGLLPCAGGTQNLTRLVGEGWAKKMILCGERVNAPKAHEIGLVEEVVSKGKALERALELSLNVEKQSPIAVSFCKRLIQNTRSHFHSQGLPLERELFLNLFNTEDQKEGVNAFLEKRKAVWKNG
jgi:enoyl-CoA hydratase/carnithine racemase